MGIKSENPESEAKEDPLGAWLGSRSIVLIGLMGAGKTSVGKRLANRLGLAFVDSDHEVEKAAGESIPDIFAKHGEEAFREGERRVISRLLENGPQVMATGGGAFMDAETRKRIDGEGISVWLKADLDILMARVSRRSNRPLLKNPDPEGVMRDLMEKRYPVYALADITVNSKDGTHEKVVDAIVAALSEYAHLEEGSLVGQVEKERSR